VRTATGRFYAILCTLTLPLCALAIWPVVEMGVMDDWSYIRTAQTLARTGHIVYNGWATAMLGWQLYLGALFARLFGSSFTSVRLSTLLIAMATAFLTHRTLVRAGIREWNATLGTLALVLSPLFLCLTFTFMTDIAGLFCIVLCLYACLRALQATTDRSAMAWICFAALSNAIGGTVRQIAWLGVLVMVPCTLWFLRRRPRFVFVGGLLYVFCVAIIFGSLHWFHKQPYSVPEPLVRANVTRATLSMFAKGIIGAALETPLLLLPVLIFFLPVYPWKNRRAMKLFLVVCTGCMLFGLLLLRHRSLNVWLAPWLRNSITVYQFMDAKVFHSDRPVILGTGVRFLLSSLVFLCILSFVVFLFTRRKNLFTAAPTHPSQPITWHHLGLLFVPFTLAYFVLLLPRAATNELFDRYLLPILTLSMIVLLRLYQEQVQPRLPSATLLGIAIFAAFGIAGTHDSFALLRARVALIDELRAAGVPATDIDGGFEYNSLVQIDLGRFINDPKIPLLPGDSIHASVKDSYGVCPPIFVDNYPLLSPRYGMAFTPDVCLGPSGFAPVVYRTWLGPHSNTLYMVKVGHSWK
jgi:Dolichyl-phosphate-mannose-protein mannosyltransferase